MMWWNGGSGWGGWLVMSLMIVVFWAVVIAGGIALWRVLGPGDRESRSAEPPTPEQLLEERLARGEIDVDEFDRRREVLRSGR